MVRVFAQPCRTVHFAQIRDFIHQVHDASVIARARFPSQIELDVGMTGMAAQRIEIAGHFQCVNVLHSRVVQHARPQNQARNRVDVLLEAQGASQVLLGVFRQKADVAE